MGQQKQEKAIAEESRREFLCRVGAGVPLLSALNHGFYAASTGTESGTAEGSTAKGEVPPSGHLTFDQVQESGHEATYEEVSSFYGGPMSKHPVISVKAHPEIIWIRPDMEVGMIANPLAFGVGEWPRQMRWREINRSLQNGHLPIVTSRWQDGALFYEQVAYSTLLGAQDVKTGHEKQVAMVRMSVVNTDPSQGRHAVLWAFVPGHVAARAVPPPPYSTYDFFEVLGALQAVPATPVTRTDKTLRNGAVLLGTYSEDSGIQTTVYTKVLKFEMELRPGETKGVCFKVSSNAKGFSELEIERLREMDFFTERDQRAMGLRVLLEQGVQIRVPEEVVNNIYKAQILYTQPMMVQAADRDYYMPVQGYLGVWPWEAMKMLGPLDATGYHQDVGKSLEYFLKMQDRYPPEGDIDGYKGYFSGTGAFEESGWENDPDSTIYGAWAKLKKGQWFPGWMNWTGSILHAFGEHYFYSNDAKGLKEAAPALIKACDWIIRERQRTKRRDHSGKKVLEYGLMPSGEPYDLSEKQAKKSSYYFCFTDGYTWQGLNRMAQALVDIGHTDGQRLLKEAKEYRQDILEVMQRTHQRDANLPPYPDHLYEPPTPGWADFACGALSLVDVGLINFRDEAFAELEHYMKKHYNRNVLGLTGGLRGDGDRNAPNAYYVDFSEDIWQRGWILRGEVEKSLLAFYSMLAYGVDKETLGSVERFDLLDRRYAPFFMDGSGGSRVLGLIRQTLMMEESGGLYLLGGVPRRWLEAGKKIEVKGGVGYFGKLNLRTESQVDQGKILVKLDLEKQHPERLREIRLRVPHPEKEKIKAVMANGGAWQNFDQQHEMIRLMPAENHFTIEVQY
jgi:hypothetical protein